MDTPYMQRCLQLAKLGSGIVAPNPMVGCVIVHNSKIIGEGYHHEFGGPHAEVVAIQSVKNKEQLKEATVYVSLEPCAHYGKTPPCANLLVQHQVKKVVVAQLDPNPLVAGKGLEILENAGIQVEIGVLESEAKKLNKTFNWFHLKKLPYVTLKWAQTANNFLDGPKTNRTKALQISNSFVSQWVHKLRAQHQGILIGKSTLLLDVPLLTNRYFGSKQPIPIILCSDYTSIQNEVLALKKHHQRIIVINSERESFIQSGIEVFKVNSTRNITQVLELLFELKIQSVLVEGGAAILESFIHENCWNECFQIVSDTTTESGVAAPNISSLPASFGSTQVKNNTINHYINH